MSQLVWQPGEVAQAFRSKIETKLENLLAAPSAFDYPPYQAETKGTAHMELQILPPQPLQ